MRTIVRLFIIALLSWGTPQGVPDRFSTEISSAAETEQQPRIRTFTIKARRYAFDPARIEVNRGDIVKLTLIAEDVPHGFEIAGYRICKRVTPEKPVSLEFLADKAGTFIYFCNLTADERCREMRGELIVR